MPRALSGLAVGEGDGESTPVIGHANELADGFTQIGAWVRLGTLALQDLAHHGALDLGGAAFFTRGALSVALPRIERGRFGWTLERQPMGLRDHVASPIADLARLAPGAVDPHVAAAAHAGLVSGLVRVLPEMGAARVDRALAVAADSYVDPMSVGWLTGQRRLKGPDHPTGLMPGEAGAALLLETEQAARLRKAEVLGHVEAVAVGGPIPPPVPPPQDGGADEDDAPTWLPPPAPKLGRAIADAVHKVLPPPAAGARWRGDLYLDLNGEYWRSEAWGHACVHQAREVDLDACRVLVPAACLGETGAASAPIAVAWALWSFDRDRTEQAIVVSVADDGATGAIRLSAPRLAGGPR